MYLTPRRFITYSRTFAPLAMTLGIALILSMQPVFMSAAYATRVVYQTYVIPTYGGADLVTPVQQQLNSTMGGGSVSSYQDKLILRTTPTGYQAVNLLLSQIDQAPQPVSITVQVGQIANSTEDQQQGRIVISHNRNVTASKRIANKQASNNAYQVQAYGSLNHYSSQQHSNSHYQVSTLSGKPATIGTSTLLSLTPNPTLPTSPYHGQRVGYVRLNNQLTLQATSAIDINPKLLPNKRVQLTIRQVESTLSADGFKHGFSNRNGVNGRVDTQQLATTLVVPFGQWVTIGEVSQSQQTFTSADSGSVANNRTRTLPIQIRID